ncbi:MAG: NAAT family transporter [Spirochaetales bacterium]|nr:MAG: NAAT family transporter [Spirochaetales bacterium]
MLTQYMQILFTILIVVDPIGIVPLFISATAHLDKARRLKTMHEALLVAGIVLSIFILGGRFILSFFGISPGAFYVAGGVMFFLISIDMLFGQPKRAKTSSEESEEDSSSIAVFPLAIPMIAGPGAITTIMLYATGKESWLVGTGLLFGALIPVLVVMYLAMRSSGLILRLLGKTGVSVVERMMGLILSGLSIQFVYDGLLKLGLITLP